MATLQSFELDRVPDITDVGIGHLVAMPKLTKILLAGLPVTDAALAHLAKMEQLQSIRLVKLPISDAGLLQLAPLKNLESLTLNQLNVTAAGVAALQEALPNCKIEWDSPKTADRFTNTLGMEFVRVPKGKSWLGGGGGKPGTQPVEFKEDFYLGKFEVTQEEWQKVMGTNPSSFSRRGSYKDRVKDISDADLKQFPVTGVTWNDCQEFVARLNATTKEDGWVYRLPKEVEWEYACRGGPLADPSESAFDFYLATPTNELLPGQASLNRGNDPAYPNKVGSYPANRLGLHDMHGNVCEWCDDEVPLDPKAPEQGLGRMTRGHGWINDRRYHGQAAQRYARPASTRDENHGLRVARVRTTTQTATAWQPLFNDKGLSGWTKGNTGSADIVIEDGQPTLRLKEPVTLSSLPIGDYQLRFEYKPSSGQYGGGVHLMGLPNSSLALGLGDLKTPNIMGHACRFHAAEIQAGQFVRIGEPVPEKTLTRLPNVSLNPTTPWQQFEVSRLGDSFVFRINGKPAGAFTNVRWLRDGNEEIPAQRAPIVFWAFGGPGQFRNVEIREINALPPEILEQAAWQPLFNGKDLTGWTKTNPAVNTGRGEVVNDDGQPALRLTKPFGLGTNSEFGSYHLRYQTKADAGAGGVHHVFRKGVGFSLVCLVDGQSVTPQLSCFGGATFQKAIWRAGQFVAEGERLNAPTKLAFPPVPAAIGWQTVEILRLDDSFLYLVNGRLAGAITNLRIVRNNESERLGTTPLEFFVGSIGPASFRNIELREITALPPELLQNLTGESK